MKTILLLLLCTSVFSFSTKTAYDSSFTCLYQRSIRLELFEVKSPIYKCRFNSKGDEFAIIVFRHKIKNLFFYEVFYSNTENGSLKLKCSGFTNDLDSLYRDGIK